jgi:hypothetical protein
VEPRYARTLGFILLRPRALELCAEDGGTTRARAS